VKKGKKIVEKERGNDTEIKKGKLFVVCLLLIKIENFRYIYTDYIQRQTLERVWILLKTLIDMLLVLGTTRRSRLFLLCHY